VNPPRNDEVISKLLRRREIKVIYDKDNSKFKNQGTSTKALDSVDDQRTTTREMSIIEKQYNNI
jgi:hypothetical protein